MSTHFSVLSRDYTGGNTMWIFDQVLTNTFHERPISITCNNTMCHYIGKYRIYIASNGAIDLASTRGIDVEPRYDTEPEATGEVLMSVVNPKNPLGFSVTIKGYAYDSEANRIASRWYDHSSGDIDMISTFLCEN